MASATRLAWAKSAPVRPCWTWAVGLDSLLAARRVGLTGKVVGVDLCREMVEKARRNAELLGLHNVEFVNAGIETLPLPEGTGGGRIPRQLRDRTANPCPKRRFDCVLTKGGKPLASLVGMA